MCGMGMKTEREYRSIYVVVREVSRENVRVNITVSVEGVPGASIVEKSEGGSEKPPYTRLTPRETDVISLLSQGMSNNDIARTLFISARTVKNHVSSILCKLHLSNRSQAALYARNIEITAGHHGSTEKSKKHD